MAQKKNKITYLGNPLIKKANVQVQYTQEQVIEYNKCMKDPWYFIEKYMKIVHVDHGLIPFIMRQYQKDMLKVFMDNRFSINKLPRQSGKSTIVTGFFLWTILFKSQQSIAILANKGELARKLLGIIRRAYEHLPMWLQQGVTSWNKGDIELENGSSIVATSTSSDAARGQTYNIIFLDEFAFVQLNMQEEFFSSVYPTITSGQTTKVIIVSTPNGMNMFYRLWNDAVKKKNHYTPIEVHWTDVPGRDQAWKEETIANTSEQQFRQEQECEFIGSVHTLISPVKLESMIFVDPVNRWQEVDIYENPVAGRTYCLTADVSHGSGLDHQAFSVIDMTSTPYRQIAKYYNKDMSPLLYPTLIHQVAVAYNNAFILVEINDIGRQVADTLHIELEYENILMVTIRGRKGQILGGGFSGAKSEFGVKMSEAVKRIGCSNLKDLIEGDKLIVQDFETVQELTTFVAKKKSFEAEEGHYDDLVDTLITFAWMSDQKYFKDLTDINIREKLFQQRMNDMDDNLIPFGIVADGQEEEYIVDDQGQRWNIDQETEERNNQYTDDMFGGGWIGGMNY